MKYIKKFNNEAQLETYKKSNFISPHVYLNSNLNTVKYMEEYQQLEYISSTKTGGQYIDLCCKLMENTDDIQMYIKFNIKGNGKDNNGQSTLIASQPEVNPYPGFVLRKTSNDTAHNNYQFIDCYPGFLKLDCLPYKTNKRKIYSHLAKTGKARRINYFIKIRSYRKRSNSNSLLVEEHGS